MYLELKAMFTAFSALLLVVVMIMWLPSIPNIFILFLIIIAIFIMVFGDMVHGYLTVRAKGHRIIDRPPPGYCTAVIFTLNRMVDFEYAKIGPHGKREFMYNGKEASVIDHGEYPIHLPNGSIGFVCHEKSIDTLDMKKVKYGEFLNKRFGTDNIKEIYSIAKEVDKEVEKHDRSRG